MYGDEALEAVRLCNTDWEIWKVSYYFSGTRSTLLTVNVNLAAVSGVFMRSTTMLSRNASASAKAAELNNNLNKVGEPIFPLTRSLNFQRFSEPLKIETSP